MPQPPTPPALPEGVTFPAGSPAAEAFQASQAAQQAAADAAQQAAARATTTISAPRTARDVAALRSRRSELSNQLNSAEGRRERLVRELNRYPEGSPARAGIEQRLQLLDQRIIQLETDIAETGRQLVAAPSEAITTEPSRRERDRGRPDAIDYTPIAIVFNIVVLMPIAVAMARRIWKRTVTPPVRPASTEDSQRLLRLEQAVDTIAVEVERISEGQRFVAQLLADGARQARALEAVAPVGRDG